VIDEPLCNELGLAAQSRRSVLIFGASGNGKTMVATALTRSLSSIVYVPHAVLLGNQVLRIYDPAQHEKPEPLRRISLDSGRSDQGADHDLRFVRIRRPVISVGTDLSPELVQPRWDERSASHHPPIQLLASGGTLVIEDFGRQTAITPRELLHRLLPALDRREVTLDLRGGQRTTVPVDLFCIFVTNVAPHDLAEEALMRRLPYKIFMPHPTEAQFAEIFRRLCARWSIPYHPSVVEEIRARCYPANEPPRCSDAEDILQRALDLASFQQIAPQLTSELVQRACDSFLVSRMTGRHPRHDPERDS
jgi:predicted ATPase with chaperone activity